MRAHPVRLCTTDLLARMLNLQYHKASRWLSIVSPCRAIPRDTLSLGNRAGISGGILEESLAWSMAELRVSGVREWFHYEGVRHELVTHVSQLRLCGLWRKTCGN